MQRSILLAWAAGLGLMTWRSIGKAHQPPAPGTYMAASGLYALCGVLGAYPPAAPAAAAIAWGFDLAVFLQVLPEQVGGPKKKK